MAIKPKKGLVMIEEEKPETEAAATTEAQKMPRRLMIMLVISCLLTAGIVGGIIVALTSHSEDPDAIELPTHTVKSLENDAPLQSTAPVLAPSAHTEDSAAEEQPANEPEQKEVPLDLNSATPKAVPAEEKPLLPKENVAPQSMIQWHPQQPVVAAIKPTALVKGSPQIVIVIDDMGLNIRNSEKMASMPAGLTLSYLPYSERLQQQAQNAFEKGHELIVHVPMEPDNLKGNNPGPNALLTTLPPAENVARLEKDLAQFTPYIGINNHMGSRMTANPAQMRPLLQVLKDKGLWFLDSRTIGNSVAGKIAGELGVPYAERDVFLDNTATVPAVLAQLKQLETVAQKKGYAVAIGHPHDATIAALQEWLPQAKAKGFQIVPLSTVIAERFPSVALPKYAQSKKNAEPQHAALKNTISSN